MFGGYAFGAGYFGEGPAIAPVVYTFGYTVAAAAGETASAGVAAAVTKTVAASSGATAALGVAASETKIVPTAVGHSRDERSGS